MHPPASYVDLDRRFAPLPEEFQSEDEALESYSGAVRLLQSESSLGWPELLKHRLVVILGEPGSGKTWEMRNQAALTCEGKFSFFLRLDELVATGEALPLSLADDKLFQAWRKGSGQGAFFLDSVDEAKINRPADFHRALDRFRDAIGPQNIPRATIVISSRVTEWIHATDGYELRIRFSSPKESAKPEEIRDDGSGTQNDQGPFVAQILPLDESRIRKFARSRGLESAESFLHALEHAHAWELARRPADVEDLFTFWRERGNLGTLTEILEFLCDQHLRKTSDRDSSELLPLDRARDGAMTLAAATNLCRRYTFRIPATVPAPEGSLV